MVRHSVTVLASILSFFTHLSAQPVVPSISSLRLLGEYDVPSNFMLKDSPVGGLSGIDYDAAHDLYYIISDDRAAFGPVRFYTATVTITDHGIDTVIFTNVVALLDESGQPFPGVKKDRRRTPDPESIRYNPILQQLFWTNEGERTMNQKDTILQNPSLNIADISGKLAGSMPLPENLVMRKTPKGPRQNGTLEGLTFAEHYTMLFTALEEPLYEDGPRADLQPSNSWIRIFQFDMISKKNTAQFAYALEPVAYPAFPPMGLKINGVPEILSLGNNKLLVVERSFSMGRLPCTVKVFLVDLSKATDVTATTSLIQSAPQLLAAKNLILNLDDLEIYIDNVEGVTVGPTLPNGHQTLLFVTDNNFNSFQKTQFLLFEVIP